MDIAALAQQYEDYVIETRRYVHQHPELSWEEFETTDFIEKELKKLGLNPKRLSRGTGLWADIAGGKAENQRTVMLRADIDALPVQEETGAAYASITKGKMHACGHDCHVAMLLGAAKILCEIKEELRGTVRLLFQPGEEMVAGAKVCIQEGVLEHVEAVYGCHVNCYLDAPYINIESGPRTASADGFKITVKGMAAHGSAPHCGKDAIAAAGIVIMGIQTLVSRYNDPMNPLVITIGTIHGGRKNNIIADHVEMEGTVRTYSNELRKKMGELIQNTASHGARLCGCTAEAEYIFETGAIDHYDEKTVRIGQEAAIKLYGSDFLHPLKMLTVSDDFADFTEQVPGIYPSLGIRNKEKGIVFNHHNGHFDVDESALKRGTAMYAQFAVDFLAS